jgi:hypothetical protein
VIDRDRLESALRDVDHAIALIDASAEAHVLLDACIPLLREGWRHAGLANASLPEPMLRAWRT